ncbi:hypothetical protein NIES1031_03040 [Chroogloeocystis siderophila 5.2 s.c.1]|jgi:hypothetical protein|uniref:Uncharacterized protein n=1 Tax=Chroogloeocystis siderophila 5.2 s.c.1 TaxID=247279 RepID=A0A1U7HZ46_9CHRO|nr:hypothetical protein NIES1031_03040 [Chroogloeocystis siderophila 5.2 s.c.1]
MYGFGSFTVLVNLLFRHDADTKHLLKVLRVLLLSFLTIPIKLWENFKFQSKIDQQEIKLNLTSKIMFYLKLMNLKLKKNGNKHI